MPFFALPLFTESFHVAIENSVAIRNNVAIRNSVAIGNSVAIRLNGAAFVYFVGHPLGFRRN